VQGTPTWTFRARRPGHLVVLLLESPLPHPVWSDDSNSLMSSVLFRLRASLRHLLVAFAFGCIALVCVPARAAPLAADVKKAAEAFDRGREAFRAENYVEAAEHFEAADAYASSAASLRLAIAARKEAGQLDRALSLAALALSTYPGDEAVVAEAQAVIDAHRADFGRVDVTCDEPCDLLLDGKLVHGPPALSHTVYVSPGSYQVQASWSEDRTDEETVTVVAEDQQSVQLTAPLIEPVEATPTEPPPSEWGDGLEADESAGGKRHGWSPVVFWTGLGATVVGAGITIGLGVNAINNPGQDAVLQDCRQDDTTCATFQRGVANQTAANVAGGITAAVGVFTIVAAIVTDWGGKGDKHSRPDPSVAWSVRSGGFSVRPTFTLGSGATLGAAGTF
jgi:hypothetical protein